MSSKKAARSARGPSKREYILQAALGSIGDAVIVTDEKGCVGFLNATAEQLTGWSASEAKRQSISRIFRVVNERTHAAVANPVKKVLRSGRVQGLANHTLLLSKDGREIPIDDSAAPIRATGGRIDGVVLVFRDITERRRAELHDAWLASIVQSSEDAIISKRIDGQITSWNLAAQRLLGYSDAEIVGKSILTIIPPELREEEQRILEHLRRDERVEYFDTIRLAKDGRHINVSLTVSPLKNSDGEVIGASKIMRDTRRRKELEMALASIGDAVIVTDEFGRVSFVNAVAEALIGWSRAEAKEQPLDRVFHIVNEFTRAVAENPVDKVLRSGRVQGLANHTVLLSKDDREIPIDDSAAPIRAPDGRVLGVVLVFRDISERRFWELRAARLVAIVESSDDAIISESIDGQISSWNQAAERLFGYTESEIVGKPVMTIIPPDLYEEERHILEQSRRGERIEHFDTVRLTKDGQRIEVSLTISPVKNSEGMVIGASKILRDIRRRKDFEKRLLEEHRLKDEFLAMLAHELRNPLAPIRTASEILSRVPADSVHGQSAVTTIQRQVTHLQRLVDDLLDVSRITRGSIKLRSDAIELGSVVAQAVETVEPHLLEKQHRLSVIPAPGREALYVNGDFARLVQCVGNILSNAAKFTDPGGEISVRTYLEGPAVVVEVTDNGTGISPELLPRVFDLFVQSDRTLDRAQGGLGIGLAVVKRLVQMHGGEVAVESPSIGQGSTFRIKLPRVVSPHAQRFEKAIFTVPPRRILIVDDNVDAANSLAALLSMQGHETQAVYSGHQALERIELFRPHIALIDIGLPLMNGYELAERLRDRPDRGALRLIALTGYGQVEDRARTHAAGFDDHLVKPVELATLERVIAGFASDAAKKD